MLLLDRGVYSTRLIVPFFKNFQPDLVIHALLDHSYLWPLAFLPFLAFVVLVMVGSSNAVNLTDGLAGLAIGCVIIATGALTILTYITSHGRFQRVPGHPALASGRRADRFLRGLGRRIAGLSLV